MINLIEKCVLEEILSGIGDIDDFDDIAPSISQFSHKKQLYSYQREALYNCLKLLSVYYRDFRTGGENICESKKNLMDMYDESYPNFSWDNRLRKYSNEKKLIVNEKFSYFTLNRYFEQSFGRNEEYICAQEFYNRCAFWMATASGKSVVIVKLIDLLKKLMDAELIPEKPILLLTPKEYIIGQIMGEAEEFNQFKENENEIVFHSLKEYETYEKPVSSNSVDVFFYRSDLIRENTTENFISHYDFDNDGNWYIILDEAHRGDNDYSLAKGYFTALTRRGFLFNFSATFADVIDFQTTLYNFNLEKFIEQKYGKNILVSKTLYTFKNSETELEEIEKQKEVLKSFIIYTAVKKSRNDLETYHAPLLMTLVGTVNTQNSDLKIYFRIIEQIVTGKIKDELFFSAKQEILDNEIYGNTIKYSLGNEELDVSGKHYTGKSFIELIGEVSIQSILKEIFNSSTYGRIEFIHSDDVQEIGMKLETSDRMFGLIKIGERDKFEKSIVTDKENYSFTKSISTKCFFDKIETDGHINMLCGSRAFYEGWDTNRPNVINLIDIGSKDAQKFVPQAIGRGIRIKPNENSRKRLAYNNTEKNQLLETLFVFATNRDVLDTIVAIKKSHHNEEREYEAALTKNEDVPFELIIPRFADTKSKVRDLPKYSISLDSYKRFREFINFPQFEILFANYKLQYSDYCFIKENLPKNIQESKLFTESDHEYLDMPWLLKRVILHIQRGEKRVESLAEVGEDTIRHFKRVRLYYDDQSRKEVIMDKIREMSVVPEIISDDDLLDMYDNKVITRAELNRRMKENVVRKEYEEQDGIVMRPVARHYYLPLMYSKQEDNKHIGSIIKVASEREFIENLIKRIPDLGSNWYFSKLLENVDDIYIPYFSKSENRWRSFYPDFIFWVKRETGYDIYFVDPKGTKLSDYQEKADYYKKFFYDDEQEQPRVFIWGEGQEVRFWLRLITNDENQIQETNPYSKFWYKNTDFTFLE